MAKLDRQGWAVGVSFRAYGLRIGLRANTGPALQAVVKNLPPGLIRSDSPQVDILYSVLAGDSKPANGVRRYNIAYANSDQLVRSPHFDDIPDLVERDLSIRIAEFAKGRVFIHAGVVGWNGKAILIPGASRAGKSTLVAALVSAGAAYYSDEFAVVDRLGNIHPYPRRIQLRNGDGTTYRIAAADLRAAVGKKPLRAGLVLIAPYQKGAAWRPRQLSPGEGMLAVLMNTVSAQRQPGPALQTLAMMLAGARVLKGRRGEAGSLAARLLRAGNMVA